MFVPSLSWYKDHFEYINGPKKTVFSPNLNLMIRAAVSFVAFFLRFWRCFLRVLRFFVLHPVYRRHRWQP